ncbi:hypothetical protein VTN31DRAFT_7193 [Thermomyces dupontii]|uniref:uncharacterized protein n=1 Tax=Talaromyces thermophilus TaxID=28565 RepID=UPI003743F19E
MVTRKHTSPIENSHFQDNIFTGKRLYLLAAVLRRESTSCSVRSMVRKRQPSKSPGEMGEHARVTNQLRQKGTLCHLVRSIPDRVRDQRSATF